VTKWREKAHILRFANVFERAVAAVVRVRSEKLMLTYGGEIRQIEIEDILYFESQDKALIAHYGKGGQFTFVSPISKREHDAASE
jgi:DNA-binding LytR/AlgR family response regulator